MLPSLLSFQLDGRVQEYYYVAPPLQLLHQLLSFEVDPQNKLLPIVSKDSNTLLKCITMNSRRNALIKNLIP